MNQQAMILTTINPPTKAVLELSENSANWPLIVVGDKKTPEDWSVPGAQFISAHDQVNSKSLLAKSLPWNHYCRKNLGYLAAVAQGATMIAETDDDNHPTGWPYAIPDERLDARLLSVDGWANIYSYFTDAVIWPRGLPLPQINRVLPDWDELTSSTKKIGVHQFLAAGDPDVDAIYRLTVGRSDHVFLERTVILDKGTMVPFNSQCTIWSEEAFPLLYLPSHVSFRMTDIWRSFVAQVCLWAVGSHVAYHGRGVYQERNEHDLQRDFLQEVIGYERNDEIYKVLMDVDLSSDTAQTGANLRKCYEALHSIGIVNAAELDLVNAWLADLAALRTGTRL